VNHFEEKAAFTTEWDLYDAATPPVAAADAVAKADVIDLTARMRPDGTLDWTPPAGDWVVLRLGYSLLELPIIRRLPRPPALRSTSWIEDL